MLVLVAGYRGKLGQALQEQCKGQTDVDFTPYLKSFATGQMSTQKHDVAVYCGKGNLYPEFLDYCEQHDVPLIIASTDVPDPADRQIKYIKVPNASRPMVTFLNSFASFARL